MTKLQKKEKVSVPVRPSATMTSGVTVKSRWQAPSNKKYLTGRLKARILKADEYLDQLKEYDDKVQRNSTFGARAAPPTTSSLYG